MDRLIPAGAGFEYSRHMRIPGGTPARRSRGAAKAGTAATAAANFAP